MDDDFDRALGITLQFEGGLSDNRSDKGGKTMKGVTQNTYDAWRNQNLQRPQDVALISDQEVATIYKDYYWKPAKCDLLLFPVAACVFDVAVNSGVSTATKLMQRVLGLQEDGRPGPLTQDRYNRIPATRILELVAQYTEARVKYYTSVCKRNNSQLAFIDGWIMRAIKLERAVTGRT